MIYETNPDRLEHNHELVSKQYEDGGFKVHFRWGLYSFGRDHFDFIDDVYNQSGINPNESLLDIGCNDGSDLYKLRVAGHLGHLVGLDISSTPLEVGNTGKGIKNVPMDFIQSSAEDLPLANDSIDSAICLFTLYHLDNQENAINEIQRVVKADGTVIISTSGKNNKKRHREFENDIAQEAHVLKPERFNEQFTSENAPKIIEKYLSIQDEKHHKTDMVIDDDLKKIQYIMALETMQNTFTPIPKKKAWLDALENVKKKINEEIISSKNHEFIDSIDRTYYICKNNKK